MTSVPSIEVDCPVLLNADFKNAKSLIIFARPFMTKPTVINKTGPRPAITPVTATINFLVPELRPSNFSNILVTNSAIGVTAFKNSSPSGISDSFKFSIDPLNLFIADSDVMPNSFSDNDARSCTDAPARSSTRAACVPSFVTFANNVERREN